MSLFCVLAGIFYGQKRIYLGYTTWYYPSLDYYRIKIVSDETKVGKYSGIFTHAVRVNLAIIGSLACRKSRFYLSDYTEFLLGAGIGSSRKIGYSDSVEKSLDALLGVGLNTGLAVAYEFDEFSIGLRYVLFGGSYYTNLDYDAGGVDAGLLETRAKYGPLMFQFGYNLAIKTQWNAALYYFILHDPEEREENMYIYLRHEQRMRPGATEKRFSMTSFGVGLNVF